MEKEKGNKGSNLPFKGMPIITIIKCILNTIFNLVSSLKIVPNFNLTKINF